MSLVLARVGATATSRVAVGMHFFFSFEMSSRCMYYSAMSPSCVLKVCFSDLDLSSAFSYKRVELAAGGNRQVAVNSATDVLKPVLNEELQNGQNSCCPVCVGTATGGARAALLPSFDKSTGKTRP